MKKQLLFCVLVLATFVSETWAQEDAEAPQEYIYDTANDLKIYGFQPAEFDTSKKYPAIVIFHGGGWSIGEASWGFGLAQHYADRGAIAFSAQYRLQERSNSNTPYESVLDAQSAIRWIRENADRLSIDKDMIAAYGWSAGAHLAACAAIFENLDAADAKVSSAPNLLALKSPAVSLLVYENFQNRLGDKITVADLSPAEHVSDKTPPTIIVIGRTDTVTPLSGSELYHNAMLKNGRESELHIYDGVGHLFTPSSEPDDGWPNPDKEVNAKARKAVDAFLKKHGYLKD